MPLLSAPPQGPIHKRYRTNDITAQFFLRPLAILHLTKYKCCLCCTKNPVGRWTAERRRQGKCSENCRSWLRRCTNFRQGIQSRRRDWISSVSVLMLFSKLPTVEEDDLKRRTLYKCASSPPTLCRPIIWLAVSWSLLTGLFLAPRAPRRCLLASAVRGALTLWGALSFYYGAHSV